MLRLYAHRLARTAILIILVLAVVACGSPAAAPSPEAKAVKTPKPTFTPPTQPDQPSVAPTITKSAPDTAAQTKPTEATEATDEAAPTTSDKAQPTAEAMPESTQPSAVPPTEVPAPPVKSLRMNSPEYGMQAFMWWRPEVASRDLQMVRDAGFGWVKSNFGWRDIEGAGKGIFDWSHTDHIVEMANDENIDLMVRIDHQPAWVGGGYPTNGPPDNMQDLADFLTALMTRYKGRIRAIEVWNEPNLAREWGGQVPDPTRYVEMLKVSYAALKAADPNVMVISAGLSPTGTWNEDARPDDWYLETMYVLMGSSDNYFDVLGLHAPGFKYAPEMSPDQVAQEPHGQRSFCFRHVEDMRAIMVKYGDSATQVAILEFGWTSDTRPDSPYAWHAVSEEVKADYLVRSYQYAKANWSPWIGLMSLIYICDADWTKDHEQYYWAVNDPSYPDFAPRPAYTALKNMAK